MGGGGGRCQLLGSLDTNMEVVTASSVWLTRGAMQGMKGAGVSEVGENRESGYIITILQTVLLYVKCSLLFPTDHQYLLPVSALHLCCCEWNNSI